MKSDATSVNEYLDSLSPDRRTAIEQVRATIVKNLPKGYQEGIRWGMLCYEVPLAMCPDTYNKQPLQYAALASQKNYMALYLTNVYGDAKVEKWFQSRYRASGKKLDMGKCCVRFKKLDDLPLDLVGEVIARTPVREFIRRQEQVHRKK